VYVVMVPVLLCDFCLNAGACSAGRVSDHSFFQIHHSELQLLSLCLMSQGRTSHAATRICECYDVHLIRCRLIMSFLSCVEALEQKQQQAPALFVHELSWESLSKN